MNDTTHYHSLLTSNCKIRISDFNSQNTGLNVEKLTAFTDQRFWHTDDVSYMNLALQMAQQGYNSQEVPVGAVLVVNNQVIGTGFNQPISACDPTAHAEIVALRNACHNIGNYRLPPDTTLYVTLEPCTMCIGALIHARLSKLVFATTEPRAGMVGSQLNLTNMEFYNHQIRTYQGLLASSSQRMLKAFFKSRRLKNKGINLKP